MLTVAVGFGVVFPHSLVFDPTKVIRSFQVWRLLTPFCFFGGFGLPTLMHLYMLVQYSQRLELSPTNTGAGGTTADYLFMLLFCAAGIGLGGHFFFSMALFAPCLVIAVLYVWCQENETSDVSMWGFKMKARMFPFALVALHLLMGQSVVGDLLGLGVGHLYFFLTSAAPSMYQKDYLRTPAFLIDLCARFQLQAASRSGAYVPPSAGPARGRGGVGGAATLHNAPPPAAQQQGRGGGMAAPGRVNAPANTGGYNWGGGGNVLGAQ
jgi:Derlin-2/3